VTRRHRKDPRHRAREAALQILYQWDVGGGEVDGVARTFFEHQWPDAEAPSDALRDFASALAEDTARQLPAIDPLIAGTAERWRPERMAVLDRLILRMAVCEMQRDRDTPPVVVINEALELARTFSTEESVKFINGMLDAIRKKIEAQ
jgi:N utilization substance protein B